MDLISPLFIFEPNIAGVRALIDFCLTSPLPSAPRLVFTSSIFIVGREFLNNFKTRLIERTLCLQAHRGTGLYLRIQFQLHWPSVLDTLRQSGYRRSLYTPLRAQRHWMGSSYVLANYVEERREHGRRASGSHAWCKARARAALGASRTTTGYVHMLFGSPRREC